MDRDRLIAVNLGEFDIRETMLKQRMFLSKTSMVYEEEQLFKILVQQAEHELHRGAFERAIGYLDKAVSVGNVLIECNFRYGQITWEV